MPEAPDKPFQFSLVDRLVGVVMLIVLVLAGMGLVLKLEELGPGTRTYRYHTVLERSYGLLAGNDVRIAGIPVGRVAEVTLRPEGNVRVELAIEEAYRRFVTKGCSLEVGFDVELAALVEGKPLHLVPGEPGGEPLPEGSPIKTNPPTSLSDILNDPDLLRTVENVKVLVDNLRAVSETLKASQGHIMATLAHVDALTGELGETLAQVPRVTGVVESGFATWQRAGATVDAVVTDAGGHIRAASAATGQAAARLDPLLADLEHLVQGLGATVDAMHASAEQLPSILSDGHALIRGANDLIDRLRGHWLLGGKTRPRGAGEVPGIHPLGLPGEPADRRPPDAWPAPGDELPGTRSPVAPERGDTRGVPP
jgi:phospholipid/cholesterol/gamma-HCH transport system substrate-binding protein